MGLDHDFDEVAPLRVGKWLADVDIETLEEGFVLSGPFCLLLSHSVSAGFLIFNVLRDIVEAFASLDPLAKGIVTVDNNVFALGLV